MASNDNGSLVYSVPDTASQRSPTQGNSIRRLGTEVGDNPRAVPVNVEQNYVRDGAALKNPRDPERVEMVDRGDSVRAFGNVSTFTTRAMAEMAQARGWKELEVTGYQKFRQGVYIEAASRDIGVRGYKPTEQDAAVVSNRRDFYKATENPVVQAYLTADTDKKRSSAADKYPQLAGAFAAEKIVREKAAGLDSKEADNRMVETARRKFAVAIDKGVNIQVEVRSPDAARSQAQAQDQGKSR